MDGADELSVKTIYDDRSVTYDDSSFHVRQAQEYIEIAKLTEGQSVLDLACGTGLITLLAKKQVGHGTVVGVDISPGMLGVARRKTHKQGIDISYIEWDITDLDALQLGQFDVVFCASALLLLKEPLCAVKHWSSLLAPNGRLLTDVMVERNLIAPSILRHIGPQIGQSLSWDGSWVESEDSLRKLFVDAGLSIDHVYISAAYETQDYSKEDGGQVFEKIVANPNFRNFGAKETRNQAELLFKQKSQDMADENGKIHEEFRFYMGIARKSTG
ncbi:MAG: hypothetical protein Q9222_002488 [Ikaeria aurantiellina]